MANTYTQIYIHLVFAVKGRASLLSPLWREDVYRYITGIVTNKGQKLMAINGIADHIHILVSLGPTCNPSDLVREIKANSARYINENRWVNGKFEWQSGFGAFSVSQSGVSKVAEYIHEQEKHHSKRSFLEEYRAMLVAYQVEFDEQYIFIDPLY